MNTSTTRSLFVYTDARVRGARYLDRATGRPQRTKKGRSTVAAVGFVGPHSETPVVGLNLHLPNRHGPQEAEYIAVIVGLAHATTVVVESAIEISHVLVCSDNSITIDTLTGRKAAHELASLRRTAREFQDFLEFGLGVEVNYEYVPRTNVRHRQAHQLSQANAEVVLVPPREARQRPDGT